MKYLIKIGDVKIDYLEISELVKSAPGEPIGRVTFITRISNEELRKIDLKDEVIVYTKDITILMGYVNELIYSENLAIFFCEGFRRTFKSTRYSMEFLPYPEISFKASFFGMRLAAKRDSLDIDKRIEEKMNLVNRDYAIIMPIDNLELSAPMMIFDVLLTTFLEPEEEKIIKASNTGKRDIIWKNGFPKAKVVVQADNFYDAIQIGYRKILTILDFITFRNDLSFIYFETTEKMEFRNSIFLSKPVTTMKVFCKEVESIHSMFYDLRPIEGTIMRSTELPSGYISTIKIFEKFYNDQTNLVSNKTLIWSVRLLALSKFSYDPIVKSLSLWNSMEFALSGLPVIRKFTKSDLKNIKSHVDKLASEANAKPEKKFSEDDVEIIKSKLNFLNDPPIMEKIKNFLHEHRVPFSSDEMRLIQKSRRKRNYIQHGKENEDIKEEELEKLRSLIEKILLVRAIKSI